MSERYTVSVREAPHMPLLYLVIDGRLQMDVYHWYGGFGKEQCDAVAKALNEVDDKHPDAW